MGPRFGVSSERLEEPGIEPTTPGLEGEQLNHYATEASKSNYVVFAQLSKLTHINLASLSRDKVNRNCPRRDAASNLRLFCLISSISSKNKIKIKVYFGRPYKLNSSK